MDDLIRAFQETEELHGVHQVIALNELITQHTDLALWDDPALQEAAVQAACRCVDSTACMKVLELLARTVRDRRPILLRALSIIETLRSDEAKSEALVAHSYQLAYEPDLWDQAWHWAAAFADTKAGTALQRQLREAKKAERRRREIPLPGMIQPLSPVEQSFLSFLEQHLRSVLRTIQRFEGRLSQAPPEARPLDWARMVQDYQSVETDLEDLRSMDTEAEQWPVPPLLQHVHILFLNALDDLLQVAVNLARAYHSRNDAFLPLVDLGMKRAKKDLEILLLHLNHYAVDMRN